MYRRCSRGHVLVPSAQFWEGVDFEVVRLDWSSSTSSQLPPGDSLVLARSQRQERAERSPFARYALADVSASLQQRSGRSIRCRADGGMLVIDGSLSMEGYVRPILATLLPTCRILKKMKSVRNRWMSLPELPPRLRTCLEPLRQVDTLGVIFLEHPTRIVSKLVHA
ncbi:MAG: hypothetical protein IPG16_11440 [Comamonadaceae bacterium]|nr:hypothetical protein [Comamonadaceae bacterium]